MRLLRRWIIRIGIVCALLAVAALLLVRWLGREPEYEGRSLSSWLADLRSGQPAAQEKATAALKAMGPEVVPYLTGELTKPPTPVQRAAESISKHVPSFIKAPLRRIYTPSHDVVKKYAALNALKAMGTNGAGAVPALAQLLREPHVGLSTAAAAVLGELGTNALPVLIAALDDGDYNIRAVSCHALASLNTNAAPAIPRLERIARDEIGPIASTAFYTLSRIGPAAAPCLSNLVSHTNAIVRSQAIYSLGTIHPGVPAAVSVVLFAAGDPVADVRWRAVETLAKLDASSSEAAKAFIAALDDPDPNVRAAAATALAFRRRVVHLHLEKFCDLLRDESPGVRAQAAFAIGRTGELGTNALPHLERLRADTNQMVSSNAMVALETINSSVNYLQSASR